MCRVSVHVGLCAASLVARSVCWCIQYAVVSVSLGEMFDVAASIGASSCEVFSVGFGRWW